MSIFSQRDDRPHKFAGVRSNMHTGRVIGFDFTISLAMIFRQGWVSSWPYSLPRTSFPLSVLVTFLSIVGKDRRPAQSGFFFVSGVTCVSEP